MTNTMLDATTTTNRPTSQLQHQLVDLARCARRTAQATMSPNTSLPMREWLDYLADDLQQHAIALNRLDGGDTTIDGSTAWAYPAAESTQQSALEAIETALEQLGNTVRERLSSLSPASVEAQTLDDLLQSLDMHWWVCHRATA